MKSLPENIELKFYNVLIRNQSIPEFEKWLYESKELKESIDEELYMDLLLINYKKQGSYFDFKKLILKHINKSEYLSFELINKLKKVKFKEGDYTQIIREFFYLCCRGYSFMYDLSDYSLELSNPKGFLKKPTKEIVENFYPEIIQKVEKVISWLSKKEIILIYSDQYELKFAEELRI